MGVLGVLTLSSSYKYAAASMVKQQIFHETLIDYAYPYLN